MASCWPSAPADYPPAVPDRNAARQPAGVSFPQGGDGRRSTQATGRAVFADCARVVDPSLAARIEHTNDWRSGYLGPLRDIVTAASASPDDALAIARAGLASVHQRFRFVQDGVEVPLAEAVASTGSHALGSVEVRGSQVVQPALSLPYRGRRLFGSELAAQVDDWVTRGIAEPGLASILAAVMADPQILDLRGVHVAVLGAGSQMGPTRSLLRWGATVHAIDLPGAANWQHLIAIARSTAGTLRLPIAPGAGRRGPVVTSGPVHPEDDATIAEVAGVNLLTDAPSIVPWLLDCDAALTIGTYAYADGAQHALLAVASDAIVTAVSAQRSDIALAYLATPTDVFAAPACAVADSRIRWDRRGLAGLAQTPLRLAGQFQPNYPASSDLVDGCAIQDALVPQQGPNYALAKRIHRWRAQVAAATGQRVSINLAPATRTRSVIRNRVLAAAYAGADRFGVEVFEPSTSTALMAALLAYDLRHPQQDVGLRPGQEAFTDRAVHGGLWRTAYAPRSVLGIAAVLGMFEARS